LSGFLELLRDDHAEDDDDQEQQQLLHEATLGVGSDACAGPTRRRAA
jgi:hypothetical protein